MRGTRTSSSRYHADRDQPQVAALARPAHALQGLRLQHFGLKLRCPPRGGIIRGTTASRTADGPHSKVSGTPAVSPPHRGEQLNGIKGYLYIYLRIYDVYTRDVTNLQSSDAMDHDGVKLQLLKKSSSATSWRPSFSTSSRSEAYGPSPPLRGGVEKPTGCRPPHKRGR